MKIILIQNYVQRLNIFDNCKGEQKHIDINKIPIF